MGKNKIVVETPLHKSILDMRLPKGVKEKKYYICETETEKYFRDEENEIFIVNEEGKECGGFLAENVLIEDIKDNRIIKVAPNFIYDYNEILKEDTF